MRIVVRPPAPEDAPSWERLGWRAAPDPALLAREHEAFRETLAGAGAEVVVARGEPGNLDSIYVFDPVLATPAGEAILLRPGKEARRGEPDALAPDLPLPVVARLEPPALAEGGDTVWLDERTLLAGRSYRTNDAGIEALRAALPQVDVLAFDLPHLRGRDEVLHLRSLLSPLGPDLAVGYPPLLPARLVELLAEREIRLVGVPDDEVETTGPNVLALAPGLALALAGNDGTRRRLARAGVEVLTYEGDEISRKGDGGPTCLTLPVDFGPARSS
ncbi:MAG TPA: arginine deiminase family protein [Gaiellaceae bacterium]|nr:arginine deiminase family protein [Gaiellaceae bacterium]